MSAINALLSVDSVVAFSPPLISVFLHHVAKGAYVTVFNPSATWVIAVLLRGYKCMVLIFVFP